MIRLWHGISLKNRRNILISVISCLFPMGIGLMAWSSFPDQIPIHFNFQGTPDDWMSKAAFFFGFPWFFAGFDLLILFITFQDAKGRPGSPFIDSMMMWMIPVIECITIGGCVFFVFRPEFQIERFLTGAIGLGGLVLGNLLPKARQNTTFGFRNSYTLNSKEVWAKVNRAGGYGMCLISLGTLLGAFLIHPAWATLAVLPFLMIGLMIGLWLYSKTLYHKLHSQA